MYTAYQVGVADEVLVIDITGQGKKSETWHLNRSAGKGGQMGEEVAEETVKCKISKYFS